MNLVERFFADITNDCIREGSFQSVRELIDAIEEYLAVRAEAPKRYVWKPRAKRFSARSAEPRKPLHQFFKANSMTEH